MPIIFTLHHRVQRTCIYSAPLSGRCCSRVYDHCTHVPYSKKGHPNPIIVSPVAFIIKVQLSKLPTIYLF